MAVPRACRKQGPDFVLYGGTCGKVGIGHECGVVARLVETAVHCVYAGREADP